METSEQKKAFPSFSFSSYPSKSIHSTSSNPTTPLASSLSKKSHLHHYLSQVEKQLDSQETDTSSSDSTQSSHTDAESLASQNQRNKEKKKKKKKKKRRKEKERDKEKEKDKKRKYSKKQKLNDLPFTTSTRHSGNTTLKEEISNFQPYYYSSSSHSIEIKKNDPYDVTKKWNRSNDYNSLASLQSEFSNLLVLDRQGDQTQRTITQFSSFNVPKYRRHCNQILGLPSIFEIDTLASKHEKLIKLKLRGIPSSISSSSSSSANVFRFYDFPISTHPTSCITSMDRSAFLNSKEFSHFDFLSLSSDDELESNASSSSSFSSSSSSSLPEHYQLKVKEFNSKLTLDPKNVELWLEWVEFQSKLYPPGLFLRERQCMILEKALISNPHHPLLLSSYFKLGSQTWESSFLERKYKEALNQLNLIESQTLLFDYLTWKQQHQSSVFLTLATLQDYLSKCMTFSCSNVIEKEALLLHLFFRSVQLLWDAGYTERALALLQAQMELTFFRPDSLTESTVEWEDMFVSFRTFWESEVPRFGEPNAQGWHRFSNQNNFTSLSSSSSNGLLLSLQDSFWSLSSSSSYSSNSLNQDPLQQWSKKEACIQTHACLPLKVSDPILDPYGVVFFDDIEGFLIPLTSMSSHRLFLFLFFHFFGLSMTSLPLSFLQDPLLFSLPIFSHSCILPTTSASSSSSNSMLSFEKLKTNPSLESSFSSASSPVPGPSTSTISSTSSMNLDFFTSFLLLPKPLSSSLFSFLNQAFLQLEHLDPLLPLYRVYLHRSLTPSNIDSILPPTNPDDTNAELFEQALIFQDKNLGFQFVSKFLMKNKEEKQAHVWTLLPLLCQWIESAWFYEHDKEKALKFFILLLDTNEVPSSDFSSLSIPTASQSETIQTQLQSHFQTNLTYDLPPYPTVRDFTYLLAPITLLVYLTSFSCHTLQLSMIEWAMQITFSSHPVFLHLHKEHLRLLSLYAQTHSMHSPRSLCLAFEKAFQLKALLYDPWVLQLWSSMSWTLSSQLRFLPTLLTSFASLPYLPSSLLLQHQASLLTQFPMYAHLWFRCFTLSPPSRTFFLRALQACPWVHLFYLQAFQSPSVFTFNDLSQLLNTMEETNLRIRFPLSFESISENTK